MVDPIYQQQQAKDGGKGDKKEQHQPEVEKIKNPIEKGEEEDKKRNLLNEFRPCGLDDGRHEKPMHIWHFVEEEESKTPHVLRTKADPNASYVDGRCQELMQLIQTMAK